mgnify:FL=1
MDKFKYINNLSIEDIHWSSYFKNEINNYTVFEKIFDNEVKNYYGIDKSLNKINANNLFILEFYYNNTDIADFFEHILYEKMKTIHNSVTLIFIKNNPMALILIKSFEMVNENNIIIPFFKYYVNKENNKNFFENINDSFRNNESILIINYQN